MASLLAKWHCGTSDWHTASRVPGPNGHLRRGAPTPGSFRLCSVLQSNAYALGITERCAVTSSCPTIWRHCSHSDLGRATSSIRPDMIFGKDRRPAGIVGALIMMGCTVVASRTEDFNTFLIFGGIMIGIHAAAATSSLTPRVSNPRSRNHAAATLIVPSRLSTITGE